MASELNMPWTHPLYCGLTGHMFGEDSAADRARTPTPW